jgi:DNA-binding MarR family transcriptional regulator
MTEISSQTVGQLKKRKAEMDVLSVQTFAELVGNASRLLTGFAALEPFKEANIGLAEWTALTLIAQSEDMNSRQVAKSLGVSAQRVNQLAESLKTAGLISVSQSSEDSRKKGIKITEAGRKELDELNEKLQPILVEPMKARPKSVTRVVRGLKRVARHVAPQAAKGAKGRADREGRKRRRDERAATGT